MMTFEKWWEENRKKSDGWTSTEKREGREIWNAAIESALDIISGSSSTGCYKYVEELQEYKAPTEK